MLLKFLSACAHCCIRIVIKLNLTRGNDEQLAHITPTYAHNKITKYPQTQPSCMFQRNRHPQNVITREYIIPVHEFYMNC